MQRRAYLSAVSALALLGGCVGGGPGDSPGAGGGSNQTPTPASSTPTPSPASATPTPTPTASPTATPSLAPIDEPRLAEAVLEAVFEARGSALAHQGSPADTLDEMASYHSERMARERTVAQVIDGETTDDRYEQFDLWCRFPDDVGRLYKHSELELVGAVSTRGVSAEEAADQLVQGWLDDPDSKETLMIENADTVGIGVTIVTGRAYVTMVYC